MKFTTVLMLAAAAILLGLAAYFVSRPTSSPPPGLSEWNTPLLKGVHLTGLSSMTISDSEKTVALSLSNGIWRVKNRYDYPADTLKLKGLLDSLVKAILIEAVDIEPAHLGDLGLGHEQGTRLTLSDPAGKPLFTLTAGAVHQKKSDDPSMAMFGGFPDGRYLLLGDSAYLNSDTLDALDDGPAAWLDKTFPHVTAGELASLSVEGPGREPVRLTRGATGEVWTLSGLPAGKVADAERLSRLTSALTDLSFDDLADPATPETTTGFSTGIVCSAVTTNGVTHELRLGNPSGEDNSRYVRVSFPGTVKLYAESIFLIDDAVLEPLLFTRDQLAAEPPKP
jgi:hypothetical protein